MLALQRGFKFVEGICGGRVMVLTIRLLFSGVGAMIRWMRISPNVFFLGIFCVPFLSLDESVARHGFYWAIITKIMS